VRALGYVLPVAAAYDDTCARCRQATAGSVRVACAGCGTYSHEACFSGASGCASCGRAKTVAAQDRERRGGFARWGPALLFALTATFCLLTVIPFRTFGYIQITDIVRFDALRLGVFVAAVVVVTRLVRH
jgi:hypothetical protein